jgi:hypothetical protein
MGARAEGDKRPEAAEAKRRWPLLQTSRDERR